MSDTALRLADALEQGTYLLSVERGATAAELRRLHALNAELVEALQEYVSDYQSEDGMYSAKHYVKTFSAALAKVEAK